MKDTPAGGISGIGGWLQIFIRILLIWDPLRLAYIVSTALAALNVRGPSLAYLLVARLLVTAFGITAGLALTNRRPAALPLARLSVTISAAMDLFVYLTPYMPNNRMPGDTPFYMAASLAFWGAWLLYLFRSRRVLNTYG
jgi:hypothetical protein